MNAIDLYTRNPVNPIIRQDALLVRNTGLLNSQRRWLTTDNTATGPRDLNVNGSVTPVPFYFGPPAGQKWGVATVIAAISDNANFVQSDFGAIPGPLTNGLAIMLAQTAGADIELYAGFRVKQNSDWVGMPAHCTLTTWNGIAQTLEAVFAIYQDTGQYNILDGDLGHKLKVIVQDNLTGLTAFRVVCRYVVL